MPPARPVLIVEDEPDIRESVREVFEYEGYVALAAENGRRALDLLAHGPLPGVVFVDLAMPVMSGLQLIAEMRRSDRLRDLPIVVVTGYADRPPEGIAAFVMKPARMETLLSLAERYCGRDGAAPR